MRRRPTPHRIRQELIEVEVEYETEGKAPSMAVLVAIVCDRLGVGIHDVLTALEETPSQLKRN